MAETLREKFIGALTIEGYQIVASHSRKYVVFKRTENTFFYIGKSGSLRFGANIATSIPVSDKHKDPVKTLGSTVSSANMRFAEPTGETKQVNRTKRGPGNKAVKDQNGENVRETKTVDVYKPTRKFNIRPVEAGVSYGQWVAPANGALIARTM